MSQDYQIQVICFHIVVYKKQEFVARLGGIKTNNVYEFEVLNNTGSNTLALEWWMKVLEYGNAAYFQLESKNVIDSQPIVKVEFTSVHKWIFVKESVTPPAANTFVVRRELTVGEWHQISIKVGSAGRLYLDGDEVTTESFSLANNLNNRIRLVNMVALIKSLRAEKWTGEYIVTTFEPISRNIKVYPVCEGEYLCHPASSAASFEPHASEPVDTATQYFAGTTFKPNTLLHFNSDLNQGIRIPVKNTARHEMQWTIEFWVYTVSLESLLPLISLEGPNAKLATVAANSIVSGELQYGAVGTSASISQSILNTWTHVALVSHLAFPQYTLELGVGGEMYATSECTVATHVYSFDFLYVGKESEENEVYMKEVRVWKIARTRASIERQMRRELRRPGKNSRLVYYFSINEVSIDELVDKSDGGEGQRNLMWNSAHYDPSSSYLVSAEIVNGFSKPLKICDEFSFYNRKSGKCERDVDDVALGLEQSTNYFTLPLSNYYFNTEWTFEFWIYIEHLAGLSTFIFNQVCSYYQPGAISIKKIAIDDIFEFSITGTKETIVFTQSRPQWIHYAFAYEGYKSTLVGYKNGYRIGEIAGHPLSSCDMNVGEASNANALVGKLRELRIWNETKTPIELIRSRNQVPSDLALAFYLPLDEQRGRTVREKTRNTHIVLGTLSAGEIWTSQADFKVCRSPYVYSGRENVCVCKLGGEL